MRMGDQTTMSSQGHHPQAQPRQVEWPVLSGLIVPPTESYVPRQEIGLGAATSLAPGETTVLGPPDDPGGGILRGLGGTGKTEVAAALAHTLWQQRAVDLVLWITASGRDAVITGYAQALTDVGEPDLGEGPDAAASRFLAWLARTERPWLVVLDDLTAVATLEGLWPAGPQGRVVVTTPRADTAVQAPNRRVVEVGVFTAREALAVLSAKLHADPDQWIGAVDLATELGFLPIALSQAGAVMADTGMDCREYLTRIADRKRALAGTAGAYPAIVAATWSLAAEMAERLAPANLARPALSLLAMLDPHGIPGAVLTSKAVCAYLTRARGASPVDETQARAALYNLARAGLVTIDTTSAARTVRVHALVQATVRQNLAAAECDVAAMVAADALLQAWPRRGAPADFEQALRDCAASLSAQAGRLLWAPDCHDVLLRAGMSLDKRELTGPAVAYWQRMLDTSLQLLGPGHAHTFLARDRLAAACLAAGYLDRAISAYRSALAGRERMLSPGHPEILVTRGNLVRAYRAADRPADSVRLAERTLAECKQLLGAAHPDTLTACSELAHCYLGAGRHDEAKAAFQETLAAREQVLGPAHPDTVAARGDLGHAHRVAGQLKAAIPLYLRTLADRERVQGPDHPDTIAARGDLASVYRAAGALKDAISVYKRTLADRERVQGPDHPDTITARANLAYAFHLAKKLKDAIPLYQRTLTDRERVQGQTHRDTITARGNLASAFHSSRKLAQAIPLYERTLADCEQTLGPGHPDTLASRGNLAHAYHTAGRHTEAITLFQQTVRESEHALGPDHPLTRAARENLQAATRS
jgi:tetratricopeptide (TPR) repeat protein